MAFRESLQKPARRRARETCECTANWCPHYGDSRLPANELHHKQAMAAGGDDEIANSRYLCRACYERAHTTRGGLGRIQLHGAAKPLAKDEVGRGVKV